MFATTAARDKDLKAAFIALPTFQRETQTTLDRVTRFANNANPLVTQLRPAARELSPTLQDLGALAPDLEHLFRSLPALIDASKAGFPAASQTLEDARPLIAQLDPFGRQVTPILQFLGLYKRELTAFFGNTVASTQAKDPGSSLHYLRTVNPLNLENLAVYPTRVGTNRTNAYAKPGQFDHFMQGLLSYETRHCNRAGADDDHQPAADRPAEHAGAGSVPARRHDHAGHLAGDPAVRAAEPDRQPEQVRAQPGDRERGWRTSLRLPGRLQLQR